MTSRYVITEEQLNQIHYRKEKNPLGKGHGSKYLPLGYYNLDKIVKSVRSHQYDPQADNIDEWCKLHEEVLKDIRTEAYRLGYHDGEIMGTQSGREKVLDELLEKTIESCSEKYEPSGMGCKCCPFLIVYDEGLECVLKSLWQEGKVEK